MNNIRFRNFVLFIAILTGACSEGVKEVPRVFVFTDINIDAGDPDDRQSLIHLFWYANELEIEGIVPDRWNAQGYEACQLVVKAYENDYHAYDFPHSGYPEPSHLSGLVARNEQMAVDKFKKAASDASSPLYVLIWGNMKLFGRILNQMPELAGNLRVITIGTDLMLERNLAHIPDHWEKLPPCEMYNWNGPGRNEIYNDPRYKDMWWLELNWTYEGMFTGEEPKAMFDSLSRYGSMGKHMKEVVKNESWAQYFRVGDTPTVLYMIDPENDLNNPTAGSWAGIFVKPFPEERPNYYTDYSGDVTWDYANPCNTWSNHLEVLHAAKATLEVQRHEMYSQLMDKLNHIYRQPIPSQK